MKFLLMVFLLGCWLDAVACAQPGENKIACHSDGGAAPNKGQAYKKKLWDGYEISLGPSRTITEGDDCTAAIYNAAGKVVFRTTGFCVVFDEGLTGKDFDGDGRPEVVFLTDTGGGHHCCWGYSVVSLFPKPHKLFDVTDTSRFEKDKKGRTLIWSRLPGPYGYTSMAGNPYAEKVYRLRQGHLVDVTPEHCGEIFSHKNDDFSYWEDNLSPDNLKWLDAQREKDPQKIGWSRYSAEQIVSSLLSRAVQHVFCRQYQEALDDLNLWPEASRAKLKADFAESFPDYPEFVRVLRESK
jgi:hypothetical protein